MKNYLNKAKEEKGVVGIIIVLVMLFLVIPIFIFVSIVLFSIGVKIAMSASDLDDDDYVYENSTVAKEAETFNRKFKNYEGEVYGSSIKTLVTLVNKTNDDDKHIVKMFGTDISGAHTSGYTFNGNISSKYKVRTYKSKDGYVNEISISKVSSNNNTTNNNTTNNNTTNNIIENSVNNESLTNALEKFIDAENKVNDKSKDAVKKYENAVNEADSYINDMQNRFDKFYYNATH